ncbi:MAG: aminoacyl-tRNA hydrolase [Alphaproteobacteria bacterium]|nr:aminoacyl-tRNA hydrolase [Alphaproteobacteria bacterium]
MYLVVGLGNPGEQYRNTRHNVGFMAVDEICDRYNFSPFKTKFDGLVAEGQIGTEKVLLLKPQTFMNLSGNSVVKAAFFYKILPENVVVIHDDIDLLLGQIKAKCGGSSGGHNGIKSIDANISPNYNRIRIGVGKPQNKAKEAIDYVLSALPKKDLELLGASFETVSKALEVLVLNGIDSCSNFLGMAQANKK